MLLQASLLLITFSAFGIAQSLLPKATAVKVRPGEQIGFALELTTSTVAPAALQWKLTPFPILNSSIQNKTLYCEPSTGKCVLAGLNSETISPGEVARGTMTAPSVPGSFQIQLTEVLGATLTAEALLVSTPTTPIEILVMPWEDINGDGKIDLVDILIAVDQGLGRAACGSADINKDAKCDILDIQLIINAALKP
jgi:hypothetical protein